MATPSYSKRLSGKWTRKYCEECGYLRTMPAPAKRCGECIGGVPRGRRVIRTLRLRKLKSIRKRRGLSQNLIEREVKLGSGTVSALEAGRAKASLEMAQAIAEVLCVSVEELTEGQEIEVQGESQV